MAITLDALNAVVLREVFLPWLRQRCADAGIALPADWHPDDAELTRLAARVAAGLPDPA